MDNPTEIVYRNGNGTPVTTSLIVANYFGKNHKDVMAAVQDIIAMAEKSAIVELQELTGYFELSSYETMMPGNTGAVRKHPMYIMSEEGFTHLAMGFTGEKARLFKQRYIKAFRAMRNTIQQQSIEGTAWMQTWLQPLVQSQSLLAQQLASISQQLENTNKFNSVMLERLERLENKMKEESKPVDKVKEVKTVEKSNPIVKSPSEKVYSVRVLYDYKYIRIHFPDFVNLNQVVEELRLKGIGVRRNTLAAWLTERGYLEESKDYYNMPTQYAARKGWAVAIRGGVYPPNETGRYRHTPYISPLLVDLIIEDFEARKRGRVEARQLALELEEKKEDSNHG